MAPTPGKLPHDSRSALDRPWARLVALGIFFCAAAWLAWLHRDDILPPEPAAVAADDPVSLCLAERLPGIEQMVADGVIDGDQAKLFRERAEALCEHQAGAAAPQ